MAKKFISKKLMICIKLSNIIKITLIIIRRINIKNETQ